ncbi:MAG: phytoene desaturase [Crocinitomicaceae bacterium]|nr:phytoene desaturase [Crocinitomicaceae bacterium]MCF8443457.1 phytoene desaturase [Crocinitomicaceae bacterium]
MSNSKKAIVVGSGIAGIASALRLRSKGYAVSVFEANSYPGGKLSLNQLGKYRFDAGPSLFTMPHYVDELFQLFDKNPSDYFQYVTNDVACHYFFPDGTFLPFFADTKKTVETVEKTLNITGTPLLNHFKKSEYIYDKTHSVFLESSLHATKTYFSKNIFSSILALPFLDIFKTMNQSNESGLNHPKLVQIFNRYATYNGSNPYQAPGILNIIPHLEHGIGSFFPTKGMHSITTSLVQLAEEMGVDFILNSKVSEILVEDKKVSGVKVRDTIHKADVVFCNSDIKPAYSNLLKKLPKPQRTLAQEPSSSAMIFYWGIKKSFPKLDLHNIFFSLDYKKEFETIFNQSTVCDDPTVYVHVSSKVVKEDAPDGCENWFVMVNVPYNSGQDWEHLRSVIRANILKKLTILLGEEIGALIEEEDYLDPIRIEQRTSSFGGALYGASSNDRTAAFFRHPNFSKIKGLYFVGGSVHPGGGIPLCLLSAKIASGFVK